MGVLPKNQPFQHQVKPCCKRFQSRVPDSNLSCFLSISVDNDRRLDFRRDAARLGALAPVLIESFADLLKILLRRAKLAGTEVATQDDDEKRDLAVTDNPLELTRPASPQNPIQHLLPI
ncbi:hypothetical protein LXL04_028988 [Taraxacum kok-saghyz]